MTVNRHYRNISISYGFRCNKTIKQVKGKSPNFAKFCADRTTTHMLLFGVRMDKENLKQFSGANDRLFI